MGIAKKPAGFINCPDIGTQGGESAVVIKGLFKMA
jgi:hypothetical protein